MKLLKKYLKDELIDLADGEIKLSMHPVTTSQQARIGDLEWHRDLPGRIARTNWCLLNLVKKIEVSGVSFNPVDLCDNVDLSDESTAAAYLKIGRMITHAAFAGEDDKKKSQPQLAPGESNNALAAH